MTDFYPYLVKWYLQPDGESITTASSQLLPVRYQGKPAMLKIAKTEEEQRGFSLLLFWQKQRAVQVFAHENPAILMERAMGHRSLVTMATQGQDNEATRIICEVTNKLHQSQSQHFPSELVPLNIWFRALEPMAKQHGGLFQEALLLSQELLNNPQDVTALHGDIHHGNILDFGEHGWRVIDPKGLIGERTFDFANIFCNPNLEVATKSCRLEEQATLIAKWADVDRTRLLKWVLAYAALSASWHLEDGTSPDLAIAVAERAYHVLHY
ncbi:MAG: 3'-kinase [Gammaproteobacteria bacterium]|nr:3'-kinase [Gammaproteobacteria bacterium]